jgi:hypothetical protein
MVYIDSISFDKANAPYQLLSINGRHADHTLFLSINGVYFFNSVEREVQKAGENPFLNNNFKEIAPLVFSNSKQIYFMIQKNIGEKEVVMEEEELFLFLLISIS